MRKIVFLLMCVMALLWICVMDHYLQNDISEQNMENVQEEKIRVLIRSDGFASEYHEEVKIQSKEGFRTKCGNKIKEYTGDEVLEVSASEEIFAGEEVLYIQAEDGIFVLPELERGQQNPKYQGVLEIWMTEQGLLLINELPLEQYLCGVVPSEMPASYPEEALKAQAVCARTYAKKQKEEERAAAFHADVDDSVSYQVYNNQPWDERTDKAVQDTEGVVLQKEGELVDAWYYSTSCGMDFSLDLSGEAVFTAFLSENLLKAYEANEPWYRWETEISLADFKGVEELSVEKRSVTGRVEELRVIGSRDGNLYEEMIAGEYDIRVFLNGGNPVITLQDGRNVQGMELLPSAFFVMTPVYNGEVLNGYCLKGGGYGHGNGMSQNGAKEMAKEGMDYVEILEKYYGKGTCLAGRIDT